MTTTHLDFRLPLTVSYEYQPSVGGLPAYVDITNVVLGLDSIFYKLPPEVLMDMEGRLLKIHEQEN